ncbi:capsid protein [Enterococcus dongliensis]|uniref:phage tail tube protein n=1 Tax=Enterococcus dongliensis TaxID=2559925 RepID=UPI002891DBD2|nr:capsid protein [Enterococcus dongliensis]MDT2639544.1 capsid protein [Enterococcus dongliensis]
MAENNKEFLLNFKNKLEIDTAGNTDIADVASASFALLAAGITTITPAAADTTDASPYYDGEGFTDSTVTGKNITFQVAGHRVFGDAAQDYVASKFLSIGDELRTLAQWTDAKGNKVQAVVTLTSIVPFGGAANAKQTFSFTMAFNGKPKSVAAGE